MPMGIKEGLNFGSPYPFNLVISQPPFIEDLDLSTVTSFDRECLQCVLVTEDLLTRLDFGSAKM